MTQQLAVPESDRIESLIREINSIANQVEHNDTDGFVLEYGVGENYAVLYDNFAQDTIDYVSAPLEQNLERILDAMKSGTSTQIAVHNARPVQKKLHEWFYYHVTKPIWNIFDRLRRRDEVEF